MRRRRSLVLMVALALAVGGVSCGGGGDEAAKEAEYAGALATSLRGAFAAEGLEIDEASAQCAGEQAVAILGVASFEEAGVTPEEISSQTTLDPISAAAPTPEQASELATALFDCVDIGAQIVAFLRSAAEEQSVEIADEKWSCVAQNAQESQLLRDVFAEQVMAGGTPSLDTSDQQLVQELIGDCLTLEDLLKLGQIAGA